MSTHGLRIGAVALVLVGLGLVATVAQAFSPLSEPGPPGFALPAKDAQMLAAVAPCFPGDQAWDQAQANDKTRDNLRSRDRAQYCFPGICLPGIDSDRDRVRLQTQDQQQNLNRDSGPPEAVQSRERAQVQVHVPSSTAVTVREQHRVEGPVSGQVQEQNRVATETQAEVQEQLRTATQAQVGERAGKGKH